MYTLGLNAVFHDSSAALVKDGHVIAAAEEERFSHVKHGKRPIPFSTYELPYQAIDYCLREAGIRLTDVDHIAYSFDPSLVSPATPVYGEADRLFLQAIRRSPALLADGAPHHLRDRFEGAGHDGPYVWHFVEHHLAHAASAYLAGPFDESAVLTIDGRGELATTSYNIGSGSRFTRLAQINMPHSLGLLYEQVTSYLGFLHASDEYKVMALASFGKPAFLKEFRDIVRLTARGRYELAPLALEERFGPARRRGAAMGRRHYDIACSLQKALEETVLELARWLYQETKTPNLCLAGGVALNCVMNARLRDEGPFSRVWVQPAAGDAGTSLGAALWIDAQTRQSFHDYRMEHAFLGPSFEDEGIEEFLRWSKLPYRRLASVADETADLLVQDKVIGWFQGRMEFGPRALGARSILASPIHASMQLRLNEIKDREDFRPVAPVVLEEEASRWFRKASVSPFMLFVFEVPPDKAALIPAVRHVDGTARVQTINARQHPEYYALLKAFQARTGVPVLVNTSFNTRGEPMVCTPRDAIESFWTSPLDALVIGPFLLEKAARGRAPEARPVDLSRAMGGELTKRS